MTKIFHISQWAWWGKLIAAIIVVLVVLVGAFFAQKQYDKRYFEGGVQTYINAQQIPKGKIKERSVIYSYKLSCWIETLTLKVNNKTYDYQYSGFGDSVSLNVYNSNNDLIENTKQIPYKPLSYDRE